MIRGVRFQDGTFQFVDDDEYNRLVEQGVDMRVEKRLDA